MAEGDAVARVLARCAQSPRSGSGEGTLVVCPGHEDKTPSLHVSQGRKGAILNCFGGCATESIVDKLGLAMADLFDDAGRNGHRPPERPKSRVAATAGREVVSLRTLADHFQLPQEHLEAIGLRQVGGAVAVPYIGEDGAETHHKLRTAITGKPKYLHPKGWKESGGKSTPYGLDHLPDVRRQKSPALIIVEGESDCWVLWHKGYPAIGIPGASAVDVLEARHVEKIGDVFIVQEPGEAGEKFAQKLSARLQDSLGYSGSVKVVRMPSGLKDPASLWLDDPAKFDARFRKCCLQAVPVSAQDLDEYILSLDQVERREVRFLWHPYIPLGKLTILAGKPGQGKSYATTGGLIAALSVGATLPGGGLVGGAATSLVFSAEDDPAEVLRPRIEDNGGDLSRVKVFKVEKGFTFGDASFGLLEQLIVRLKPRLVVFDPLVSFMGGKINIHKQNEVRQALQPLINIAQKHDVAILIVAHVTKGSPTAAIDQIMGSVDFSAAVRSALIAYPDPDKRADEEGGIIAHAKHNLTKGGPSLRYVIEGNRFMWRGTTDASAQDLATSTGAPKDEKTALAEAIRILRAELAGGPKLAREVLRACKEAGIASTTTVARARWAIPVLVRKRGYQGSFEWYLPTAEERAAHDADQGAKREPGEDLEEDRERPPW